MLALFILSLTAVQVAAFQHRSNIQSFTRPSINFRISKDLHLQPLDGNRYSNGRPLNVEMSTLLGSVESMKSIPLPKHDLLVEGKLDNGFSYIILPNAVPEGRFEAHLEVLSGSAHELERQVMHT